ncbi:MAG: hypothetical protein ACT4N4_01665 [Rhodospirillales bacterium]
MTDFGAADVLDLVRRVEVIADKRRARYAPHLELRLADGTRLEWEERERADAYLLTWATACDMTNELVSEAGIPATHAERMIASVSELDRAARVEDTIGAMREACRASYAASGQR